MGLLVKLMGVPPVIRRLMNVWIKAIIGGVVIMMILGVWLLQSGTR